ncbi:hypothetical protein ACFTAO_24070 [Paenibacillus rhizoplanae]
MRDALPKDVTLYYSMKVNPNPEVCRLINGWGSPIEVASVGEYEIARSNGVNPNSIVFTGPGKSVDEIHHVLRHGIYAINAESIPELFVIHDEAVALGIAAPRYVKGQFVYWSQRLAYVIGRTCLPVWHRRQ